MRQILVSALLCSGVALLGQSCDSKDGAVDKGREAVKEVVTQPFNTLNSAKESLQRSEDKQKAALDEADKETK
ncbi:MAG TPA: hypothetical protein VNT76_12220 [Candidatus Binatus sp.]|nr:hypothetical protein [Candidatus Binatus sp.]